MHPPDVRAHHPLRTTELTPSEAAHYAQFILDMTQARERLGMTQAALDHRLGISEGMTAKWESRQRFPGSFNLMCWCLALGVRLRVATTNEG